MRPSTAHKALCALLAVALVALPALTTAARVVPSNTVDQQVHQRALKTSDYVIGYLPCFVSPSGVVVKVDVEIAIGALIGWIPICRGPSGIYLGAFISLKAGLGGIAAPHGTLPPALGVAVSLGVGIAIGEFIPCYHGAPASSLLPIALGVGIDLNLDLTIGGLSIAAAVDINAAVGLGAGAAVAGALTVRKTVIDILGLVQLGSTLGCLPYITAPTTSKPCGNLDNICLGPVAPWGSTPPAPVPANSIIPSTFVAAGIRAQVLLGYFPIYLHPTTATTSVLGLVELALGVSVNGISVGGTKCRVSGSPCAYVPMWGHSAIAH